ncbi:Glycosidase [Lachnospiraceae bacterium KH1T2]|nr:Glycosidase [Lachnospiraceae bacterium KH1T2]
MNKEAILHMPLSQYAYAIDEDKLTIRIRTAKNDVNGCSLFYGDRVAEEKPIPVEEVLMHKCASDDLFDYYEATFQTEYTRVCYYFKLKTAEQVFYYCVRGFFSEKVSNYEEFFQFPFIRREEVVREPEWTNSAVMYHIFPDSFADARHSISAKSREIEDECAVYRGKNGGTIAGIRENLDYLEELGVNLIYLNPIFKANSYHKYDTVDYFDIDPCFGTKDEFRKLVEDMHSRNMKIILDGVFNHCGPDFFAFKDVLEKGEASQYVKWFYRMEFPVRYEYPPNYDCFAYVKEMPKLNTSNDEVRNFICEVGKYWIHEFDIDGWRLDVANEVDHDTWRAFRKAVKEVKKDAFLIAEIWEDAEAWLGGSQFDSAMNYSFTYLCRDFFASRNINAIEFDEQMQKTFMRYPLPVTNAQMNFLDSHDVPRFLYYCGNDVNKLKLAYFYLMMSPGIPSIFYGDECFVSGDTEDLYRAPMPWQEVGNEFSRVLRKWIELRKNHKALTKGIYKSLYADEEGLYIFERKYESECLVIIINNSEIERIIELKDIIGGERKGVSIDDGQKIAGKVKVGAFEGRIVGVV